jgi:ABC-type antimicrobial peptide transport system permease subunit
MQEIGVRMALGASPRQVMGLIMGETALFSGIAVVLGVGIGLVVARSMKQLLFQISTADPLTFALTALTIVLTTIMAAMVPTRRAMRADPMVVLRV